MVYIDITRVLLLRSIYFILRKIKLSKLVLKSHPKRSFQSIGGSTSCSFHIIFILAPNIVYRPFPIIHLHSSYQLFCLWKKKAIFNFLFLLILNWKKSKCSRIMVEKPLEFCLLIYSEDVVLLPTERSKVVQGPLPLVHYFSAVPWANWTWGTLQNLSPIWSFRKRSKYCIAFLNNNIPKVCKQVKGVNLSCFEVSIRPNSTLFYFKLHTFSKSQN